MKYLRGKIPKVGGKYEVPEWENPKGGVNMKYLRRKSSPVRMKNFLKIFRNPIIMCCTLKQRD